jgi:hypothetical protein
MTTEFVLKIYYPRFISKNDGKIYGDDRFEEYTYYTLPDAEDAAERELNHMSELIAVIEKHTVEVISTSHNVTRPLVNPDRYTINNT